MILKKLNTSISGLSQNEVQKRIEKYGYNEIGTEAKQSVFFKILENTKNPLNLLLIILAIVSYLTGDKTASIVMLVMVTLGVILKFIQELKADNSAEKLKSMVSTTATVVRDGVEIEVPLKMIVPGDVVHLSAGDMIPADIQLIKSKDLFVNQSALTGESLPVEKKVIEGQWKDELENPNLCFMGTNVESGTAFAVVLSTGKQTSFGKLSSKLTSESEMTSFDKGINKYTWLMIKFIFVMVPIVFLINGLTKGNWIEAFLFGIAVAVGLTPEMLPMIVTVNLSKGALSMAKKKVIVKKLNAIQNFGAMDILCTDKTGTITCGKVILEKHLNIYGNDSERVLKYGFINSFYQTGLKNIMDIAILEHKNDGEDYFNIEKKYLKIDEIPFDFVRKRMSVVVENKRMEHVLVCKGAVEEVLGLCNKYETKEGTEDFNGKMTTKIDNMIKKLNAEGFRVIAVAYKIFDNNKKEYTLQDENELTLLGFLAFLDPPKETSKDAITKLHKYNVDVKVLTGDNEIVTKKICEEVNLPIDKILLGNEIDMMSDEELAKASEKTSVFAKLSPMHKERIIKALQSKDHVVGFMGDGINDAPALKVSDVGISVDTAVDIAKESSDIVLLENNLLVLEEGLLEGRKVFGNIVKYIKMTASSNFGNMFSVIGASIFVPFLPMMPLQVLTNNLLYDLSQTTIPTDSVDEEWIAKPRKWSVDDIKRFIIYIGPISSIFDYTTYFVMLYIFKAWNNPALFQTGWFLESLFTQTLIIHVIRTNKIPFIESRASKPLTITSLLIVILGVVLVNSPLSSVFGFTKLPLLYYLVLAVTLFCYVALTQVIKMIYIKKYNID
ncbi:magnesium-translocating P-type ATPase [Clostridium botulinum]|uniref:magnesium-translocating P-type ATPase n=1 Tax=Clostridium botulinum TaxID=1491 RepID=UPI0004D6D766|nr:magnesium-translocating P-type ATPase [Clostridium botulinum]KEI04817.1 magnesium ABC transporter ATPase [Clostridium botulinum C/D str. BKT75002]KEI08581.1 magnesium ABC transporter ATPase [Clostridium botulinum C/D str. BKT2873]KGM95400.1 magnesium ABC transporter ATPase [Clostridium botulinum D str. CCUG 7971]KOC46315.1 magnesium ABC transporter ATPase [Clostridium botulinum]MCD3351935.1 magnesium-translocating P-type ATPase [Clostridium botulinum D/C]